MTTTFLIGEPIRHAPLGTRYTYGGIQVYYRCLMGHYIRLGRPRYIGEPLDQIPLDLPCPDCFPYTRVD